MAVKSEIDRTDTTWNPTTGCYCYVEREACHLQGTRQSNYRNGVELTLQPHMLERPLEGLDLTSVDWVIVSGDTGPRARPTEADWRQSIRDKFEQERMPVIKSWGGKNKKKAGRVLDGRTWDEVPPQHTVPPGGSLRRATRRLRLLQNEAT